MKKLFIYLLKKYSRNEEDRIKIHEILHHRVEDDYTEQTVFGNIYNHNIEFILSNSFIRKLIEENRMEELDMIRNGLKKSTDEAIKYIKNEPRRKKLKKLKQI